MMAFGESAPLVDCHHPHGRPCGLCLDVGVVRRSLLYADEQASDREREQARVWTDLSEPPVTAWFTVEDGRWLLAVLGALVSIAVDGVRQLVCVPARWRWGP